MPPTFHKLSGSVHLQFKNLHVFVYEGAPEYMCPPLFKYFVRSCVQFIDNPLVRAPKAKNRLEVDLLLRITSIVFQNCFTLLFHAEARPNQYSITS